jgi:hypothetical protein
VARAKKTERAEARRRYRAATGTEPAEGEVLEAPAIPAAAIPRGARDRRPASAGGPDAAAAGRPSFLGSLRAAVGTVDIPGDLRAFPSIVLRSKAGWVPALIVVGTTVAMLIPTLAANELVALAGNVILQPPPMIIAFLAGMLAPRAAWLMGGVMGLLAGIGFMIVAGVSTLNTSSIITPLGFTYLPTADQKSAYLQSIAVNALVTGVVFGIAVGAFAGFYRRFLNMSSPQRQASRKR